LLILWNQNDRAAQLHVSDDIFEQTVNGVRQFNLLAAGADQRGCAALEHAVQFANLCLLRFGQGDWFLQHHCSPAPDQQILEITATYKKQSKTRACLRDGCRRLKVIGKAGVPGIRRRLTFQIQDGEILDVDYEDYH